MISHKGILARKCLVLVLVSVSLCMAVSGEMKVRCLEREREALVSFKEGLIDETGILSSWGSDEECCKWYGVVCSNSTGNVIGLQLGTYQFHGVLGGKVTSSLLELHHLYYLDLSLNDFGGDRIPEFIGSMKQLQYLYLWDSNFSGIVPPQIGNLTNLRSLDLSFNSLRTQNLNWLSNMSFLCFLDLSQFDLSHTNMNLQHILLSRLHSLQKLLLQSCSINDLKPTSAELLFVNSSSSSLSILDLSKNNLTFSALDWLSNISTSLVKVDLSENALAGQINPNAFERLTLLEHLDLSSNMLEGEFPESLSNLSHLRVLDLAANCLKSGHLDDHLTGNLSSSYTLEILDLSRNEFSGSVPDLRAFTALTQVYLDRNKFTGSLPLSLGRLWKLEALDVSRNYLKGAVSQSLLMKLHNLRMLDLSFNSLTLHIAPHWNPPFQLKYLFLAGCNIGPSFPKWIQTQRNISWLDLSSAGIIDQVPNWLWSFSPWLQHLFLSDNQINGTIPRLSFTSIKAIDVSSNKISGPIPLFHPNTEIIQLSGNMLLGSISSICKTPLYQLQFLDLSSNQLSGEIPNCWLKMPNLISLSLSNNSFSGEIPHTLGSLQHLGALQMRDNILSGELPSTLRFCRELILIDVGGNNLTGYIPTWIGAHMHYLNFGSNKFYGTIPPQICNLTHIKILDVSKNNLSGEIPDCFNKFTSLAHKSNGNKLFGFTSAFRYNSRLPNENVVKAYNEYSSVQWKGRESEYRRTLNLLKLIDFSSNRLIGSIPKSFSSMRGLISLNLSTNNLRGNIIPDIGQMQMLECLDLSHNQFSGQIPTSLAQLQFLAILDLSNNSLYGEIPSSTQLQSFNISSYAGNDGLCGPPLALCPKDQLRPPTTNRGGNTNEKANNGFWRLSFMQEFGISMGFGFIVGFWGVVGSLIIKKSWRHAYFNFLDAVGDWFYVKATIYISKFRQSYDK